MAALLQFENVSYQVGGRSILENITWCVESGQHWAVLGANGSGKTTLLKLACGYLWPNAGGEIRRLGETSTNLRDLRRSIGWVTSTLNARIRSNEKVLQTVLSGRFGQIGWMPIVGEEPTDEDLELARHYLRQMGLLKFEHQSFCHLSQGEQQSVLVARARMAQPLLIILDEPCIGMDPGVREQFLGTLADFIAESEAPSLILVTHHLEEILPEIQNVLVLRTGQIAAIGNPSDVIDQEILANIYNTAPPELVYRGNRTWPVWSQEE